MIYVAFYDNIGFNSEVVPVEFSSEKQLNAFVDKYQYFGGYKQFNYDVHGGNKKEFVEWLNKTKPLKFYSREPQITKYRGEKLYTYMMSIFGIKIR